MPLQIILLSFEGGTHIFQERKMKPREVRGLVSDKSLESSLDQPQTQQQVRKDFKHCWNPWDLLDLVNESIKESHSVCYPFAT